MKRQRRSLTADDRPGNTENRYRPGTRAIRARSADAS
jgi:hypothetical protein